ncbi:MAG: PaaI family thioesterase [Hyphomicrobiales bacterium]
MIPEDDGLEAAPVLRRMHAVPAYREFGLRFTDAGRGWAELTFEPCEKANNFYGFVHGGVWLLAADSAMGGALATLATEQDQVITTQLDFRWLHRFGGEVAVARGRVRHRGRSVCHCDVEFTDEDGKPFAAGSGTYVVMRPEAGGESSPG